MGPRIAYEYFCILRHHSWSRHKAYRVMRHNGTDVYFTYHLVRNKL